MWTFIVMQLTPPVITRTTPTATNVLTNVANVLLVQGVGAVGLNGQTQAATGAHGSVQLLQNRVARHRHDAEH